MSLTQTWLARVTTNPSIRLSSPKIAIDFFGETEFEEKRTFIVDGGATLSPSFSIKAGSNYKFSSKFKLENIGVEIGAEDTTTHHHELKYTYTLPGGI